MFRSSAAHKFLRMASSGLVGLLWCATAFAQSTRTFPAASPTAVTVGPDGAIWFASYVPRTIGRINADGTIREFPTPHSSPLSIASGPDGNIWYTTSVGRIGRMTTSGAATEFALPNALSRAGDVTPGPDGNVWFTETGANVIGRITTSGTITEFAVPAPPGGLTAGPDGNIWFTEPGKIGRLTTAGTVTELALPGPEMFPFKIVARPDGSLWFTLAGGEWDYDHVGQMTPAGLTTVYDAGDMSAANGIISGADGNLWVAGRGTLYRVTTSGSSTEYSLPTVGNPFNTNPFAMTGAPDGSIWVADYLGHQIVQFTPDAAEATGCVTNASTLCLGNGRFRVTADWKAGDGSTGHGHGVGLTPNSGYFWFFEAANVEMIVKVLDGCETNQHDWVFAAGLTNVEVTTTVTDTVSGLSRTYMNTQGTPFAPIQDTTAFAGCP